MLAEFSPSLGAICAKQANDTASINAFVECRATGGLSLNEGTYRCRFNLATTYVSSNNPQGLCKSFAEPPCVFPARGHAVFKSHFKSVEAGTEPP